MPSCSACSAQVDWSFANGTLQIPENEPFPFEDVKVQLRAVLVGLKYPGNPALKDPPVFTLCSGCWREKAASWDGGAELYAGQKPPKAKTTAEGVFFNVTHKDHKSDGHPSTAAILSCMTHEMMHFWSCNSTGFSPANLPGGNWDEAFTDLLAFRTFSRLGKGGEYVTPYGDNNCKFIDKMCAHWKQSLAQFKVKQFLQNEQGKRDGLPGFLRGYFESVAGSQGVQPGQVQTQPLMLAAEQIKTETAKLLEIAMGDAFSRWYFEGPHARALHFGGIRETIYPVLPNLLGRPTAGFLSWNGGRVPIQA